MCPAASCSCQHPFSAMPTVFPSTVSQSQPLSCFSQIFSCSHKASIWERNQVSTRHIYRVLLREKCFLSAHAPTLTDSQIFPDCRRQVLPNIPSCSSEMAQPVKAVANRPYNQNPILRTHRVEGENQRPPPHNTHTHTDMPIVNKWDVIFLKMHFWELSKMSLPGKGWALTRWGCLLAVLCP